MISYSIWSIILNYKSQILIKFRFFKYFHKYLLMNAQKINVKAVFFAWNFVNCFVKWNNDFRFTQPRFHFRPIFQILLAFHFFSFLYEIVLINFTLMQFLVRKKYFKKFKFKRFSVKPQKRETFELEKESKAFSAYQSPKYAFKNTLTERAS